MKIKKIANYFVCIVILSLLFNFFSNSYALKIDNISNENMKKLLLPFINYSPKSLTSNIPLDENFIRYSNELKDLNLNNLNTKLKNEKNSLHISKLYLLKGEKFLVEKNYLQAYFEWQKSIRLGHYDFCESELIKIMKNKTLSNDINNKLCIENSFAYLYLLYGNLNNANYYLNSIKNLYTTSIINQENKLTAIYYSNKGLYSLLCKNYYDAFMFYNECLKYIDSLLFQESLFSKDISTDEQHNFYLADELNLYYEIVTGFIETNEMIKSNIYNNFKKQKIIDDRLNFLSSLRDSKKKLKKEDLKLYIESGEFFFNNNKLDLAFFQWRKVISNGNFDQLNKSLEQIESELEKNDEKRNNIEKNIMKAWLFNSFISLYLAFEKIDYAKKYISKFEKIIDNINNNDLEKKIILDAIYLNNKAHFLVLSNDIKNANKIYKKGFYLIRNRHNKDIIKFYDEVSDALNITDILKSTYNASNSQTIKTLLRYNNKNKFHPDFFIYDLLFDAYRNNGDYKEAISIYGKEFNKAGEKKYETIEWQINSCLMLSKLSNLLLDLGYFKFAQKLIDNTEEQSKKISIKLLPIVQSKQLRDNSKEQSKKNIKLLPLVQLNITKGNYYISQEEYYNAVKEYKTVINYAKNYHIGNMLNEFNKKISILNTINEGIKKFEQYNINNGNKILIDDKTYSEYSDAFDIITKAFIERPEKQIFETDIIKDIHLDMNISKWLSEISHKVYDDNSFVEKSLSNYNSILDKISSIELSNLSKWKREQLSLKNNLLRIKISLKQFSNAKNLIKEIDSRTANETFDHKLFSRIFLNKANLHIVQDEFEDAKKIYKEFYNNNIIKNEEINKDFKTYEQIINKIIEGKKEYFNNKYKTSVEIFKKAREDLDSLEKYRDYNIFIYLKIMEYLTDSYYQLGEKETNKTFKLEFKRASKMLGNLKYSSSLYYSIAQLYLCSNSEKIDNKDDDIEKAKKYLNKAEEILNHSAQDRILSAKIYNLYGNYYCLSGKYDQPYTNALAQASDNYNKSISECKEIEILKPSKIHNIDKESIILNKEITVNLNKCKEEYESKKWIKSYSFWTKTKKIAKTFVHYNIIKSILTQFEDKIIHNNNNQSQTNASIDSLIFIKICLFELNLSYEKLQIVMDIYNKINLEKCKNPVIRYLFYLNKGNYEAMKQHYTLAKATYEESKQNIKDIGNIIELQTNINGNLNAIEKLIHAKTNYEDGNYTKALEILKRFSDNENKSFVSQFLSESKDLSINPIHMLNAKLLLTEIYHSVGHYQKSCNVLLSILDNFKDSIKRKRSQIIINNKIGDTFFLLGNLNKAKKYFLRAVSDIDDEFKKSNPRVSLNVLLHYCNYNARKGKYSTALEKYDNLIGGFDNLKMNNYSIKTQEYNKQINGKFDKELINTAKINRIRAMIYQSQIDRECNYINLNDNSYNRSLISNRSTRRKSANEIISSGFDQRSLNGYDILSNEPGIITLNFEKIIKDFENVYNEIKDDKIFDNEKQKRVKSSRLLTIALLLKQLKKEAVYITNNFCMSLHIICCASNPLNFQLTSNHKKLTYFKKNITAKLKTNQWSEINVIRFFKTLDEYLYAIDQLNIFLADNNNRMLDVKFIETIIKKGNELKAFMKIVWDKNYKQICIDNDLKIKENKEINFNKMIENFEETINLLTKYYNVNDKKKILISQDKQLVNLPITVSNHLEKINKSIFEISEFNNRYTNPHNYKPQKDNKKLKKNLITNISDTSNNYYKLLNNLIKAYPNAKSLKEISKLNQHWHNFFQNILSSDKIQKALTTAQQKEFFPKNERFCSFSYGQLAQLYEEKAKLFINTISNDQLALIDNNYDSKKQLCNNFNDCIEKAEDLTQMAINHAQKANSSDILYLWHWQMGRLNTIKKNIPKAKKYYYNAISMLEAMCPGDIPKIYPEIGIRNIYNIKRELYKGYRRQGIIDDKVKPVYIELVDILLNEIENGNLEEDIKQKQLREIITIMEHFKASELQNFFEDECINRNEILEQNKQILFTEKSLNLFKKNNMNLLKDDKKIEYYLVELTKQKPKNEEDFKKYLDEYIWPKNKYWKEKYEKSIEKYSQIKLIKLFPENLYSIDKQAAVIYPISLPQKLLIIILMPQKDDNKIEYIVQDKTNIKHLEYISKSLLKEITLDDPKKYQKNQPINNYKFYSNSRNLYNLIIKKVKDKIFSNWEKNKRYKINNLIFVPDSTLRILPFSVFHDGSDYLFTNYNLTILPSITVNYPHPLKRTRESSKDKDKDKYKYKTLLVGSSECYNYTENNIQFNPLPGVHAEIAGIEREYSDKMNITKLMDKECTIYQLHKEFEENSYSIIHLATHGYFGGTLEESFLLLYKKILFLDQHEIEELMNLKGPLKQEYADLLVLSACETAAGNHRASLGIAGVAIKSGVSSTIASLWPVDDKSASKIFIIYYKHLFQSSKSNALSETLKEFITKNPDCKHPQYWAPFILIGSWL